MMEAKIYKPQRGGKPRIPFLVQRKRPGKGPEPSELIAALENLKVATQAELESLAEEHEVRWVPAG